MPSTYILDEELVQYLYKLGKKIENKKYWSDNDYDSMFKLLKIAITVVESAYMRLTGTTLQETSRRLFEDVQGGGIETFVSFYNGYLFIRKLQYKLRWHRKNGRFPD